MNLIIASFMERPGPISSTYKLAFVAAVVLAAFSLWGVSRFIKSRKVRLALVATAAVGLALFGWALREEYLVSRAESFLSLMRRMDPGTTVVCYSYNQVRVRKAEDGTVHCPLGTPEEIDKYLKRKKSSLFTGTVISTRDRLLPTSASTTTNQSAPLRVAD